MVPIAKDARLHIHVRLDTEGFNIIKLERSLQPKSSLKDVISDLIMISDIDEIDLLTKKIKEHTNLADSFQIKLDALKSGNLKRFKVPMPKEKHIHTDLRSEAIYKYSNEKRIRHNSKKKEVFTDLIKRGRRSKEKYFEIMIKYHRNIVVKLEEMIRFMEEEQKELICLAKSSKAGVHEVRP